MGHYYPDINPGFWDLIDQYINNGAIVSVREVFRELDREGTIEHLRKWAESRKGIFAKATEDEFTIVSKIFHIPQFTNVISEKKRLSGYPFADPFVVAAAVAKNGTVVTEESTKKPNSTRIPEICKHFGISCMNIEAFMKQERWCFR